MTAKLRRDDRGGGVDTGVGRPPTLTPTLDTLHANSTSTNTIGKMKETGEDCTYDH
ncbi:hypothetical protein J6590_081449 [Homalodisca vitripennis]|nr:hypothetical protein J6590_081449 [Homalodisca vitripennis]